MTDMKKGSPTGLYDSEFSKICMGDIVEMFGTTYKMVYAYGAFGLVRQDGDYLDWDMFEEKAEKATHVSNFCRNDHFVSLWELVWNSDELDDVLYMVIKVVER